MFSVPVSHVEFLNDCVLQQYRFSQHRDILRDIRASKYDQPGRQPGCRPAGKRAMRFLEGQCMTTSQNLLARQVPLQAMKSP